MQIELHRNGCTAIADTDGGELISFQDKSGREYIWSGDPAYWSGRNPILFPIVGDLKNGRVRFGGKEYRMPRHGFARRSSFVLAQHSADSVTFQLCESDETLKQYPFPFLLRVTHRLLDCGFQTIFEIENTGTSPLPFCIGAHTAFRCPVNSSERFEDYQLVFDHMECASSINQLDNGCLSHKERTPILCQSSTLELSYPLFDELDTLTFEGLHSKGVRLVHQVTGHGVYVEFTDFPMAAFWTKPHAKAPYLCIEPWHGCAAYDTESGDFEDKPYCIVLPAQNKKRLRYTVSII